MASAGSLAAPASSCPCACSQSCSDGSSSINAKLHVAGRLSFFGDHLGLSDQRAFAAFLAPLRKKRWFVYAKPPFAGPEAVLAYLSRYTHRVAIANSRLTAIDQASVTFRYKDYRRHGRERYRTMTLEAGEFIRRFLLHVLPKGFHRIRHYGLLASATRKASIARARVLLTALQPERARPASPAPACFSLRFSPRWKEAQPAMPLPLT